MTVIRMETLNKRIGNICAYDIAISRKCRIMPELAREMTAPAMTD
jgi:hypothetical protein